MNLHRIRNRWQKFNEKFGFRFCRNYRQHPVTDHLTGDIDHLLMGKIFTPDDRRGRFKYKKTSPGGRFYQKRFNV